MDEAGQPWIALRAQPFAIAFQASRKVPEVRWSSGGIHMEFRRGRSSAVLEGEALQALAAKHAEGLAACKGAADAAAQSEEHQELPWQDLLNAWGDLQADLSEATDDAAAEAKACCAEEACQALAARALAAAAKRAAAFERELGRPAREGCSKTTSSLGAEVRYARQLATVRNLRDEAAEGLATCEASVVETGKQEASPQTAELRDAWQELVSLWQDLGNNLEAFAKELVAPSEPSVLRRSLDASVSDSERQTALAEAARRAAQFDEELQKQRQRLARRHKKIKGVASEVGTEGLEDRLLALGDAFELQVLAADQEAAKSACKEALSKAEEENKWEEAVVHVAQRSWILVAALRLCWLRAMSLRQLLLLLGGLQVQSFDYNEPQAEKYIWMHQLTMMKEDQLESMRCGLACEMLPEVSQVRVTRDALPLDTRGIVTRYAGDDCAIVFRGSKSLLNYLLADFDVKLANPFGGSCPDCKVHRGFYKSWQSLESQTLRALSELGCEKRPVRLSGHSLGGAMAMLAAFQLSFNFTIKELYTFGQPRVGDQGWVDAFEARMAKANVAYFRVTDYMDPVPHLPPAWLMGYRHAAPEVWYNATMLKRYKKCKGPDDDTCSSQFSLVSALFHMCNHCSYLGLNPCYVNADEPECMQGDLPSGLN
ncbi:unnamed protein product [Effrenium voratum]|uniref:Fungal lipase-type domain-containing protein n=1 Tax=Effrenium voratum TaxID=2562239 RepID=A0AA36J7I0_9DINO|nr:unnamed protein product [Effrenium voratum]